MPKNGGASFRQLELSLIHGPDFVRDIGIGVTPFGVAADMGGVVRTRGVVSTADNLRGLVKQARIDEQGNLAMATATGRTDLVNVGGGS